MTSAHVIFIPGVALGGIFIGFILGMRAARNQLDLEARRAAEREAAKAARAARDAARAAAADDLPPKP